MTTQLETPATNHVTYTAESYTCFLIGGTSESGWSVKEGDDTIQDFDTEKEAQDVAETLNRMQP